MSKLKFGIIGCGRISYKGVEAIANNKTEATLVATCDVLEEKAIEKKEEYIKAIGNNCDVKIYTDYKEMLKE